MKHNFAQHTNPRFVFAPRTEFITMMTGQPYKSPEPAGEQAQTKATEVPAVAEEGTHPPEPNPASPSFSAAARGLSTLSARLQRQRQANQVYKDAWAAIDPSLKGSIAPDAADLAGVAAAAGLDPLTDEDVRELVDPEDERGGVTCGCPTLTLLLFIAV